MENLYDQHWRYLRRGRRLRVAIVASVLLHVAILTAASLQWRKPPPNPVPLVYEVTFLAPPSPEPPPEPVKQPPPPPPPPPKEEPKPEPKKEEPKPEPKKEVPKPKPEPKKVAEKPKPEPKKEEPKPEKKPDPPKPPPPKKELPQPEVVAEAPPPETGVKRDMLPPMLNAWGRQVQRKVEKYWMQPGGVKLEADQASVEIAFWVGRDGMLLSQPAVRTPAANPALAQSGVQAVINAQPLPPLPVEYSGDRAEVVYTFSLLTDLNSAGGTL